MDFEFVTLEEENGIATVTINRPKILNALNINSVLELMKAFSHIQVSRDIKGAIITGSGDKAFIAGADIAEIKQMNGVQGKEFARTGQQVFSYIENIEKPVIAAVNGYALGGGCELALACNIRIASKNAMFGLPEVKLGLIPGYGGTQRLTRTIGIGRAMEMILMGDMIDAEEAYRIGLVNSVVESEELLPFAKKVLSKITANAPVAVKLAMEAINHGMEGTLEEGMLRESDLFGLTCSTNDMKEGTGAFLEKRKPEFKGE